MTDTVTLFVCHGDDGGPRIHPCRRVQEALRAGGIEYDKVIAGHGNPIPFLRKGSRDELREATGTNKLPALKLPDGRVINHSRAISPGSASSTPDSSAQEPLLEGAQLGCRCRAELVTQTRAQPFIDAQRLSRVAARDENFHEQGMRVLPKRLGGDELARHALAWCQLGATDPERNGGVALERRAAYLVQPPAVLVGPREVLSHQEAAPSREEGD
jgi:hypothetical protein